MNRRDFISGATSMTLAGLWGGGAAGAARPDYAATGARLARGTPRDAGFWFPAEWEPHDFTLMVFPSRQNWEGHGLDDARHDWAEVAHAVAGFEPVVMVVDPEDEGVARRFLSRDVETVTFPVNDAWSRDTGPMVLVNEAGERRVAGFTFNGWGAKFPPYADDALLKARLADWLGFPIHPVDLVMEGGGVAVDGEGTVITTEECLLHSNRNPGLTKEQVEGYILDGLGADKVIWLGKGLQPDPVTDGHVDGLCAFAAPGVVLLHTTNREDDPVNHPICQDALRRLRAARDAKGRRLEIVEVPLTSDSVVHMNFYVANGGIIVPTAKNRAEDDEPLGILREVFPRHQVVAVDGRILAAGGGGVHCITQQVPKVS